MMKEFIPVVFIAFLTLAAPPGLYANRPQPLKPDDLQEEMHRAKAALAANPENLKAHNDLGVVYLQLGRIAEAQKEFNAALAIETRYSIGPWLVGNIHTDAEQYQSQIDRFEEIIVQNQEYARARNNLALAHLKTGNLELARREAEEAIQINSRFAEAHNTLALIQERQGRADLAIKSYQKALDLDPDNPVLLYNAALAYDSMDSGPKAMELLKRAHRIYQDAQEGPKEKHLREVLADWKRKYQPQSQNPAEIQMAEEIRGQEEKKNIAGSQSSSIRPQVEPLKKPGTGELEKEAESSNQPSGPKILKVTQPSSSPSERRDREEISSRETPASEEPPRSDLEGSKKETQEDPSDPERPVLGDWIFDYGNK